MLMNKIQYHTRNDEYRKTYFSIKHTQALK